MGLSRLLQAGSLTALGQVVGLLAGLWLLRVDAGGLGLAYVGLTSVLAVTQATVAGMLASDLMWVSTRKREDDDEIRQIVRGGIVVSVIAAMVGAIYSFAGHGSWGLAIAIVAGAMLNTSIEAVHYGSGRPVRGAAISLLKAVAVPAVFLLAWSTGGDSTTACICAAIAFAAFAGLATADRAATLGPERARAGVRASLSRTAIAAARGLGPAANSLQRSAPLAALTPFAQASTVHWLYVFYAFYNVAYGGFRLLSQVAFRDFASLSYTRRVGLLLSIAWICVLATSAVAWFALPVAPAWLPPAFSAALATACAAAFMGWHARMTLFGRFRAYTIINASLLALVLVVAITTTGYRNQLAVLVAVAALAELIAGLAYRRETATLSAEGAGA